MNETTRPFLKRKQVSPVYETIVTQIRQSISDGSLQPGDQLLSERELSEQFGVSRTSVRKALAILAGMGLIEVTPRDGAYVRQMDSEQAIDLLSQIMAHNSQEANHLYEVRRIIEVQAARLAAMRREESDIERLRQLVHASKQSLHDSEPDMRQADMNLHIGIAQATKNPFFGEMMKVLISALMNVFDVVWTKVWHDGTEERLFATFVEQHELILQAIIDQDPDTAALYMTQHIEESRKRVEQVRHRSTAEGMGG